MNVGKVAAILAYVQAGLALLGVVGSTATSDGLGRPRDGQFWALAASGLVVAAMLVAGGLLIGRPMQWPLAVAALASLAVTAWWYFFAFSAGRGDWEILAIFAALLVVIVAPVVVG